MNTTCARATAPGSLDTGYAGRLLPVLSTLALLSPVGLSVLSGCTGLEGTIAISVVTAPDSDLRDRVVRARITSSDPVASAEVERASDGTFALDLELIATGAAGTITFEGFDDDDVLIALGRTPPLPIQAVDAEIAIYVGPPMSLSEAPVALPTARSDMGAAQLPSGAVLAGGRQENGDVSDALDVYSAYSHDFQTVRALPAGRADISVIAGSFGSVYLFGGIDDAGRDSSTYWRLDTTNADPTGRYGETLADEAWARAGASVAAVASEQFLIAGDPALRIDGITNRIEDQSSAPALAGTATTIIFDGDYHTLFIGAGNGDGGGFVLTDGTFTALDEPALRRIGHSTVVLPDATALTLGGQTGGFLDTAGFTVDPRSGDIVRHTDLLAIARTDAAIAATPEHIVIAGGRDSVDAVVPDAEILDANTLAPIASLPMLVPRHGAEAVALPNGQVAIFGGLDTTGQPVATIELFTPPM